MIYAKENQPKGQIEEFILGSYYFYRHATINNNMIYDLERNISHKWRSITYKWFYCFLRNSRPLLPQVLVPVMKYGSNWVSAVVELYKRQYWNFLWKLNATHQYSVWHNHLQFGMVQVFTNVSWIVPKMIEFSLTQVSVGIKAMNIFNKFLFWFLHFQIWVFRHSMCESI